VTTEWNAHAEDCGPIQSRGGALAARQRAICRTWIGRLSPVARVLRAGPLALPAAAIAHTFRWLLPLEAPELATTTHRWRCLRWRSTPPQRIPLPAAVPINVSMKEIRTAPCFFFSWAAGNLKKLCCAFPEEGCNGLVNNVVLLPLKAAAARVPYVSMHALASVDLLLRNDPRGVRKYRLLPGVWQSGSPSFRCKTAALALLMYVEAVVVHHIATDRLVRACPSCSCGRTALASSTLTPFLFHVLHFQFYAVLSTPSSHVGAPGACAHGVYCLSAIQESPYRD